MCSILNNALMNVLIDVNESDNYDTTFLYPQSWNASFFWIYSLKKWIAYVFLLRNLDYIKSYEHIAEYFSFLYVTCTTLVYKSINVNESNKAFFNVLKESTVTLG